MTYPRTLSSAPAARLCLALVGVTIPLLVACGGSTASTHGAPSDAAAAPDATSASDATSANDATSPGSDAGTDTATTMEHDSSPPGQLDTVTFQYTPSWQGVTAVSVVGGFGTSTDWMPKTPFVKLTQGANGTFTGTAQLAAGTYPYVFIVTSGAMTPEAKASPYYIDPTNPAFTACPMASPTFDKTAVNPCSELTVPQPAAAPMNHLTGTVTYDATPIAGYLVLLERNEPMYHHYAVNRTVTASDGSFDCSMAPGKYRVQVLYPTYYSQTDAERDPLTLQALRRSISGTQTINAATQLPAAEVSDHGYAMYAPVDAGAQSLPVRFTYTVLPSTTKTSLDLYGPGASIGDPWYTGAGSGATSSVFDGGFNTAKATTPTPEADASYWWGTTAEFPGVTDGGIGWEGETMVFPVVFQ